MWTSLSLITLMWTCLKRCLSSSRIQNKSILTHVQVQNTWIHSTKLGKLVRGKNHEAVMLFTPVQSLHCLIPSAFHGILLR